VFEMLWGDTRTDPVARGISGQYVSVAMQRLSESGEYVFIKGRSFALRSDEAREVVRALESVAGVMKGSVTQ
jgi:hypothetical protein